MGRLLESLLVDIRFGLRAYGRKPLATVTIVVVLALGIGANAALFSVIEAFTSRPAPGVSADIPLARVYGLEQANRQAAQGVREMPLGELAALASREDVFTSVAGWTTDEVVLRWSDAAGDRGVSAEFVTPEFWRTIGARADAGSVFGESADPVAVISAATAREMGRAPQEALGMRLTVNGISVRVAGVTAPRFQGAVRHDEAPALWLPLALRARVIAGTTSESAPLSVAARLAPGVSMDQASAAARRVAATSLPPGDATGRVLGAAVVHIWEPPPLAVTSPAVGFAALGLVAILILAVASSNVSSLLVAMAVGRRQEIAVRLSLGASRARIVRQLVTESAILALAGGFAGLGLYWALVTAVANRSTTIGLDLSPDFATAAFTALLAVGTGIFFGLSPALHATSGTVGAALRDSGAGVTGKSRLQRIFVGAQIVFSQPLLLLLALILSVLLRTSSDMSPAVESSVTSVTFRPVRRDADVEARRAQLAIVTTRLIANADVRGVVAQPSAFSILTVPLNQQEAAGNRGEFVREHLEGTTPGYFALLGVPIVLGRDVALGDTAASEIRVVVGRSLARRLWGEANPLGRAIVTRQQGGARDKAAPAVVVVGVYDDSFGTTRGDDRIYTAYGSHWRDDVLLVRSRGLAAMHAESIKADVRSAAPSLPIARVETLAEIAGRDRQEAYAVSAASAAAGGLALFLASIGLFAVVSIAVGQRRREIGLRIALGGQPRRVAAAFLGSGMQLSATGLLIGLPVSALVARVAVSQGILILPEVSMTMIAAGIGAVVLIVAGAASWIPARRAAAVDPSSVLRS